MIRAIRRAFDIIEFLGQNPDTPKSIAEIAENVGLPVATCGRILQTLVASDYVEQLARKRGFVLGPMAYLLASRGPYRRDLVRVAEPEMRNLANRVRETVLLVALHRGKRFELCKVEGGRAVQVCHDMAQHERIYETATGRGLLAWLDPKEVERAIERNGMPGKGWPEANTKARMARELQRIRREGRVILSAEEHIVYVAYPVYERDRVVAAAGIYLPDHRFVGSDRTEILEGLDDLARSIGKQLSHGVT